MFLIHNKTAEVDITLIDISITNCAKKSRNFLRKFKTLFFNEQIIPTRSVITSGWWFTLQKNRFMLDEKVLAKHLKICYLFWSILLILFIKHQPIITEEWTVSHMYRHTPWESFVHRKTMSRTSVKSSKFFWEVGYYFLFLFWTLGKNVTLKKYENIFELKILLLLLLLLIRGITLKNSFEACKQHKTRSLSHLVIQYIYIRYCFSTNWNTFGI